MSDSAATTVALPGAKQKSIQHDEPIREMQRLMREVAPILWSGIRRAAYAKCDSLNQRTGKQLVKVENRLCDLMIICGRFESETIQLLAEFDSNAGSLHWRVGNYGRAGRYELCFGSDKKVAFYDSRLRTIVPSPDEVVDSLLNAVLLCAGRQAVSSENVE